MNSLKSKFVKFYEKLSNKEKLSVTFFILIIFIFFYYFIIKNNFRENEIDYDKLSIDNIIESSEIVYDRDQILMLNDALNKIFKCYYGELIIDNKKITIKNLYNYLVTNNYKKELSYSKFKKNINNFYNKVFYNSLGNFNQDKNYIEKVYYSLTYDMYLIKIYEEIENEDAYIGIKLVGNSNFVISYIE